MLRRRELKVTAALIVLFSLAVTGASAQTSNMRRAHEAFDSAKAYKNQGDLVRAEKMYEQVLLNSPADTNVYREATNEINYYLPLLKIQRLLLEGKTATAEGELLKLQQKFEAQPLRRQEIGRILGGLKSNQDGGAATEEKIDERLLLVRVKRALNDFYSANDRYPPNAETLAAVLALNQPPLSAFDLRRYSTDGSGYLLILRSKKDPSHILTLQNTGLMQ